MRQFLKLIQIIDYQAPKESGAIFRCRLIDNDLCSFGFDTCYDTLDATLAEVTRDKAELYQKINHFPIYTN